jgi:hypothetical protein
MVRIYELYSRKRSQLTQAELDELGSINAASKGLTYLPLVQFANQWPDPDDIGGLHKAWRQSFFLPPGVSTETGPDAFSAWGDNDTLVCTEYMLGNSCHKGYYIDWFFRPIGSYYSDNLVKGQSDLEDIGKGFYKDFKEVGPEFLKAVAKVASNYPGIGTAIASAATFLVQVGAGASVEDATLAAGRAAVPSALQSAYDVGVGLATRGEIDYQAALDVAMAIAISQGFVTGDVLERYQTIQAAYEDAKEVGAGLEGLGTAVNVAV